MERTERALARLVQGEVGARSVTEGVRAQHEINPLRGIHEVERSGITESARAEGSRASLELAATSHVKFVNDHAAIDVSHADMQREVRLPKSQMAKQRTPLRTAAINKVKLSGYQPAGPGCFVVAKDSSRGEFFELLLEGAGKFNRGQRLADRHFAIGICLMTSKDRVIDAERANINCLRAISAHATVRGHV